MRYLNLDITVLTSAEFLGAGPVERATWLCLMRFCAQQETGGKIAGSRTWKDRKWQQLAAVTAEEVETASDLWSWDGDDLVVSFYPVENEQSVRSRREAGKKYGKGHPKTGKSEAGDSSANSSPDSSAKDKGKGKGKGKGKDKNKEEPPKSPAGGLAVGDDVDADGLKAKKPRSYRQWTLEEFTAEVYFANHDDMLTNAECLDFVGYWRESSPTGRTRLQMQKTWDTRRRMHTAKKVVFDRQGVEGKAKAPWARSTAQELQFKKPKE